MRKSLFVLLASLPLTSFSQNVVTNLVRLPIFCDVAGSYQGTYTGGGAWSATIDPYTGLVSASIKTSNNLTSSTGSIHKVKGGTVFSLNLPDGSAWRGKFAPSLAGKWINFDSEGSFNATRVSTPAICQPSEKQP